MSVLQLAKNSLQRALRYYGWEFQRYVPREANYVAELLKRIGVEEVFDVGANVGQYSSRLIDAGFEGRITSFEPLPAAHGKLKANAEAFSNWQVYRRCAIGSQPGKTEIHESENSVSSSILDIEELHLKASKSSNFVASHPIDVVTLETILSEHPGNSIFAKVDTQGFELEVFRGAKNVLENFVGFQFELSMAPLYDGQPYYIDFIREIEEAGFQLFELVPGFRDRSSQRLLQADAIFLSADVIGKL